MGNGWRCRLFRFALSRRLHVGRGLILTNRSGTARQTTISGPRAIGLLTLIAAAVIAGSAAAEEVPSCAEFAAQQIDPGSSPRCAPLRLERDRALATLQNLKAERMDYVHVVAWYAAEWARLSVREIWAMLSAAVSATQSVYGDDIDVLFLAKPECEGEKRWLLTRIRRHWPPAPYLVAHARPVAADGVLGADEGPSVPKSHLYRRYVLIVHGIPAWRD